MSEHVEFPMFESADPPCRENGCRGNLILTLKLTDKTVYRKCSQCQKESSIMVEEDLE